MQMVKVNGSDIELLNTVSEVGFRRFKLDSR